MTAKAADNRRSNGQFGPGNRANPGGRPSLPDEFKAKGPDVLRKLLDFTDHEDPRIALRATEVVVERIYGKPTQPLEFDAEVEAAIASEFGLAPEQVRKDLAEQRKHLRAV